MKNKKTEFKLINYDDEKDIVKYLFYILNHCFTKKI